jgi:hypothetical protein
MLAVALFVMVYLDQEHEIVVSIPLVVEGVEAEAAAVVPGPERVRVRLSASGRTLARLRVTGTASSGLVALVRPEGASGGIDRPLVPEDIVIPLDLGARVVEIVEPKRLSLRFAEVTKRELPVRVVVVGSPASGHAHSGEFDVDPRTAIVEGPRTVVDSLTAVETEPVDLEGRDGPLSVNVALRVPAGLRVDPAEVSVVTDVEKTSQIELEAVPVIVRNARRYEVRPVPVSVRLTLIGPESRLAAISEHHRQGESTGLVVALDAGGLGPGAHELTPSVELPSRLRLLSVEPPRILLHILPPPATP